MKWRALLPLFTCFGVVRRLWSWNKRFIRWGWQYHIYRKNLKAIRDYIYGNSLFSRRVQESVANDEQAVHLRFSGNFLFHSILNRNFRKFWSNGTRPLWQNVYVAGTSRPMPLFLRFPVTWTEICSPCFKIKWKIWWHVSGTWPRTCLRFLLPSFVLWEKHEFRGDYEATDVWAGHVWILMFPWGMNHDEILYEVKHT